MIQADFSAGNVNVMAVSVPDGVGSFSASSSTVSYNSTVGLTVYHNYPSSVYHFEGWSFSPNPTDPIVHGGDYFTFVATQDTTAYAHFSYIPQDVVLTVVANNSSFGTVTANSHNVNGDATSGTSIVAGERNDVTLTATPNSGYTFVGWMKSDGFNYVSTDASYTFTLPDGSSDVEYIAYFAGNTQTFTVQATRNIAEGGTVSPATATSVIANNSATFSATPSQYYSFNGWKEGNEIVSNDNPLLYEHVARNITLEAQFAHLPWTVTVALNPVGSGSVVVSGTPGTNNEYDHMSTVTLTANANEGYRFDSWNPNIGSSTTATIQNLSHNYNITANFIKTYSFSAVAEANGSMNVATDAVNHNGRYDINSQFTVTATPDVNYDFAYWTVNGVTSNETSNEITIELTENTEVRAYFVAKYHVELVCNPDGVATLSGEGYYTDGEPVTVSFSNLQPEYNFDGWYANTQRVSEDMSYSFTAASDITLIANFTPVLPNYSVTVINEGNGTVEGANIDLSGDSIDMVAATTVVTLTPVPAAENHFVKWVINSTNESTSNPLQFEVSEDFTVKAVFAPNTMVNVTVVKHPNNTVGEITPNNTSEWPSGMPLTLTATVTNSNYQFWGWIIDGAPVGAMGQPNLTITPTQDVTVHAWFYAPTIDGTVDYLEYSPDSSIVTGVKADYRNRVTSINIPRLYNGAVTAIADGAFQGCTSLETLNLVPTVTTVGEYAFSGCTALTNIDVSNVTSFGADAFYGCTSLQEVSLSNSLTAIPNEMFYNCSSLQTVNIPAAVETIGNGAFYGCRNLYSVEIPAGVTTIGNQAFMGNSNLRVVTINGGVTAIGTDCFRSCNNIAQVNFNGTIEQWMGIVFDNTLSNPASRSHSLTVNGANITNLVIPAGVTAVNAYAFYLNTNIETITIPASVTSIDSLAFGRLTNLRRIILEGNPESINVHEYAFSNVDKANVVVEVPCAYTALTEWNGFTRIVGSGVPVLTLVQRVGGTVAITSTPDCGSTEYTYHITAQATSGTYQFVSWSDGAMSPDRDITITEDMTLSAIFNRSYATTPITDKTYDFEAGNAALEWFNIGTGDNEWMVGDAVAQHSYGTHSLYVTKDDGATCSYNLGSEPYVYTEMKLHDGIYRFSFNYLINDIEDHNVTIAFIPIEDNEADDTYLHLSPDGDYPLVISELNGNGNWQDVYRLFEIPTEQWYRLVFFWNINSDVEPANVAAAIDNVTLNWMTPKPSDLQNLTATVSVGTDNANMGTAYTWTGDEAHFTMGNMSFPVSLDAVHANTIYNAFHYTDDVWIHALPADGYRFAHWNDGNTEQDRQLSFFAIYGNAPHYTAYFEPIPVDWTITVLLEDGAEEAGVPASGEYGVVYKVGAATISGTTYDVTEVRQIASVDDDPTSQATLVVNQPLAEWAFMGWANENGDTISRENPWTITYGDWNRDVVFTALMSKRVECSNNDNNPYYTNPGNPSNDPEMPELREAIVTNIKVAVENNQIVVENTGDYTVTLYDVAGRAIERRVSADQRIYFDVPLSGSYLIRVGDVMTQRVVVVK